MTTRKSFKLSDKLCMIVDLVVACHNEYDTKKDFSEKAVIKNCRYVLQKICDDKELLEFIQYLDDDAVWIDIQDHDIEMNTRLESSANLTSQIIFDVTKEYDSILNECSDVANTSKSNIVRMCIMKELYDNCERFANEGWPHFTPTDYQLISSKFNLDKTHGDVHKVTGRTDTEDKRADNVYTKDDLDIGDGSDKSQVSLFDPSILDSFDEYKSSTDAYIYSLKAWDYESDIWFYIGMSTEGSCIRSRLEGHFKNNIHSTACRIPDIDKLKVDDIFRYDVSDKDSNNFLRQKEREKSFEKAIEENTTNILGGR